MRRVEVAERAGLERAILEREPGVPTGIDPGLAEWLVRVEEKLDLLLDRAGIAPLGFLPKREGEVVLSGSGLRVPSAGAAIPIGTLLLLELDLPLYPTHRVRCLAAVVHSEDGSRKERGIALEIRCIHEHDRDAIVRHTLAVQRGELLRRPRRDERAE